MVFVNGGVAPLTVVQFVVKPVLKLLVCDCNCQP